MIAKPIHKLKHQPGKTTLVLGATGTTAQTKRVMGFSSQDSIQTEPQSESLIEYSGDAHLVTVAPTRSGKGVGVVIPNLLWYGGSIVVFDPKGEAYMVSARRRRELGQQVIKLDPFGVTEGLSDSLNPFDIFSLRGVDNDADAQTLAEMVAGGIQGTKEPFWDLSGKALTAALIGHAASHPDPEKRNLCYVQELLSSDDTVYNLAVLLDLDAKTKRLSPMCRREIASFLQMPDITRGGVLATAQTYMKAFTSPSVVKSLCSSSFSLADFVRGKPLTIYIIIPPDRLHAFKSLLKLWIGTLLKGVFSRQSRPELKTLFLLDEAAQLESFPLLESMATLSAGYSCWLWLILQDLAQLQTYYPQQWTTLLNNCEVLQTFGIHNRQMGTLWSNYLERSASDLLKLSPSEQILLLKGQEICCQRLNYLTDGRFQGLHDTNGLYAPTVELPLTGRDQRGGGAKR